MTQPDDEETKEQPAYPEPDPSAPAPPGAMPPPATQPMAQPPGVGPTPPMGQPPMAQPPLAQPPGPGQWQPQAPQGPYQPPAQAWQGQPPPVGQTGWQQPPPAWQPQQQWQAPPPYGAPPPGWQPQAQPWAAQPPYGSSMLVAIAGLVLIIFGLLIAVLGGWLLTQGPEIGRFIREMADRALSIQGSKVTEDTMRSVLGPMPGVLIVIGVLQLLVGAVLFTHRGWARWLGVLLALIGLLAGVVAVIVALALVPGVSIQLMVAAILLLGYAFVVLALIAGGSHFRRRYPGR